MKKRSLLPKIITIILILAAVALVSYALYAVFVPESAAQKRQDTEESLADAFLEAARESGASMLETTEPETTEEAIDETTETYVDEKYYTDWNGISYTPDYATGTMLGVLEIDSCQVQRGVYGGSWDDIEHDLAIWMLTEARPDYVLGQTHFVIYGHNQDVQNLSFNRLQGDLKIGDTFTFTTSTTVWVYEVTDFQVDWRDSVTSNIVDNFSLPADKMYIVTCGQNEYNGKDIVFVGTLRGTVDVAVYDEDPDYYKNDPAAFGLATDTEETGEETTEAEDLIPTSIELTLNDSDQVVLSCTDGDGNQVSCTLGVYDMDGLPVCHLDYPDQDTVEEELTDGTQYICGVVTMDEGTEFAPPDDVVFIYHAKQIQITELTEENLDSEGLPVWVKPVVFGLVALILVLIAVILWPSKKKGKY